MEPTTFSILLPLITGIFSSGEKKKLQEAQLAEQKNLQNQLAIQSTTAKKGSEIIALVVIGAFILLMLYIIVKK